MIAESVHLDFFNKLLELRLNYFNLSPSSSYCNNILIKFFLSLFLSIPHSNKQLPYYHSKANMLYQDVALKMEGGRTRETSECQAVTSEDLEDPVGQADLEVLEATAAVAASSVEAAATAATASADLEVQEVQVDQAGLVEARDSQEEVLDMVLEGQVAVGCPLPRRTARAQLV